MKVIKVGSRESVLAVTQSNIIINDLNKMFPDYTTELVTMKTTGDKILDKTLDKIGGKGLFVRELDLALTDGRVDITVHSLKDMPMETDENLPITAYSKRENPFDVLVLPENGIFDKSKPIGCASARRSVQLASLYPDVAVKPVRGNVQTRLKKLESGEFSALVLAAAGLKRLGLEDRIARVFTADEMLPAAGQGIIAVQCKRNGGFDFVSQISDNDSEVCAIAERACIKKLNGGCSSPAAAFCNIEGDKLHIRAMNLVDGKVKKAEVFCEREEAAYFGEKLGEMLL
jgi:hydroxymethylbilane synthase